jgi:hypothetical protein
MLQSWKYCQENKGLEIYGCSRLLRSAAAPLQNCFQEFLRHKEYPKKTGG